MKIDINCDLGEGMGNDELLMPFLGSCNIACGGHFGNQDSMTQALEIANQHKVKVGAHPSFPDKQNFGRKNIKISQQQLQDSLYQQISDFIGVCQQQETTMHHIKLHGALYNLVACDAEIAALVLNVFAATATDVKIYVPYNSVIAVMAEDYFPVVYEAFADRRYHCDLSLVNRSQSNAVISDKHQAWQQISTILQHHKVMSVEGDWVDIKANTFCVHGDQNNALEILKYIHKCLSF